MKFIDKVKNSTSGWLWFGQPNVPKVESSQQAEKNLSKTVLPVRLARIKQDTQSWRVSIDESERPFNPFRVLMQQIYVDTVLDGHVKACVERRKDLTLLRDWQIVNPDGKVNEELGKMLNKQWFNRFMSHSLDALFYGYSLIELGDVVDNQFKNIKVVKRWNVSPDRHVVSNMAYNLSGTPFLQEPWRNWHVYVSTPNDLGTSECGYGALYEVALYQIFLRNILGYNGDFLELFGQPVRVGRTNKIDEAERGEFAQALSQMGSAGWILLDAIDDTIQLIESGSIGDSYKAFENFESRLQKLISKILLGHADALDSTSGKLGATQGDDNPIAEALEDRQSKDGVFVTEIINDELFPRLRKIGFKIPEGVTFEFKNDHEIHENNNRVADIAVKIKNAGMQMKKEYFEEQTGIQLEDVTVSVPPTPGTAPEVVPAKPEQKSVKDKIQNMYK